MAYSLFVLAFAAAATQLPALLDQPSGGERVIRRGPGGPGGPGRVLREPAPLEREAFDKAVTALFAAGDRDRDGSLTLSELRATLDSRREAAITERFRRVDRDDSGAIDLAEFTAWQQQLGSAAMSDAAASGQSGTLVPEVIAPDLGNGDKAFALRQLIVPLNSTMLVEANADHDGGVTLAEMLAYQGQRFEAADTDGSGEVSPAELDKAVPGDQGPRRIRRGPGPGGPDAGAAPSTEALP